MKPDIKCGLCLLEWVYERAIAENSNEDIPPLFKSIVHLLAREMADSANVGALCNQAADLIYEFVPPESDFWRAIKRETNDYVRKLLPQAAAYVNQARTPRGKFQRACSLAATGNVSPMGAPAGGKAFSFPEALAIMTGEGPLPVFIGDAFKAATQSNHVFYVTDNAGEIGFDALLVAQLKGMGKDVTVVVKEPAYFEDATLADAEFFNLNRTADRIVTVKKVFVPGNGKSAANRVFRKSDLVISKGTGNYEALRGETQGKSALFLLKIKCAAIARDMKISEGKFVVKLDARS
ncbi:MAG: ARMT1-like domain-containing protein [Syntrophales bacterium]|jgi:hypothetical protein|nr:ARMT1-like domain-containing protein [Syntrophales bacterium]